MENSYILPVVTVIETSMLHYNRFFSSCDLYDKFALLVIMKPITLTMEGEATLIASVTLEFIQL